MRGAKSVEMKVNQKAARSAALMEGQKELKMVAVTAAKRVDQMDQNSVGWKVG